jgi:hypothetical protein
VPVARRQFRGAVQADRVRKFVSEFSFASPP